MVSQNLLRISRINMVKKKKQGKYKVKFRDGSYKYEYELQAPNGKIIEWEYEYTGTR